MITDSRQSLAFGVNDAGEVVGSFRDAPGEVNEHAFVYRGGTMIDLGVLGRGTAINNAGDIVGFMRPPENTNYHAFLYTGHLLRDLGTLGGTRSYANAISDKGVIVGSSTLVGDAATDGFIFGGGNLTDLPSFYFANAINDAGRVAGGGHLSTYESDALIYDQYGQLPFTGSGFASGNVFSLNGNGDGDGDAVGYIGPRGSYQNAMLWRGREPIDLNTLVDPSAGVHLVEARGINDSGQIAAEGITSSGESHGFLLTPIPEPAATLPLLAGSLLLARRNWEKNKAD